MSKRLYLAGDGKGKRPSKEQLSELLAAIRKDEKDKPKGGKRADH